MFEGPVEQEKLRAGACREEYGKAAALGVGGEDAACACTERERACHDVASRIVKGQFPAGVVGCHEDFRVIAGAGKDADPLLEKRRSCGRKIGEQIRRGVPQSQKGFRGDGLPQAHQGLATRKRKNFNGAAEDRARERS